ncbi:MAG: hypothetical protein E7294_10590 [Lachnospiraceae bacterium]|jgi:citrate lyase beta subunit|nr:hypothetical protein [Lachnospiraceae bacterium]
MKNNVIYYSVGALLYCPANKKSIADSIASGRFGDKYSLALCLEDTINDNFVTEAEYTLIDSIVRIYNLRQTDSFYLPKIFIRVRNPEQIIRLSYAFGQSLEIITGFIIPKFNSLNADVYLESIAKINQISSHKHYMMPIYESSAMIDLRTRYDQLYLLKEKLAPLEELVLNIRVGGNDLCHLFGFRRHANESIHKIRPVANIFSDIITVYGTDYVVSGPVWEYYAGANWEKGMTKEIADDKLCGFIGKTVIHPNQISVVNHAYQVSEADFHDAKAILHWNKSAAEFVSGSNSKERMNEYKTHTNWAEKIMYLSDVYGIRK